MKEGWTVVRNRPILYGMKLIKWIAIVAIIAGGILLIKDLAGNEQQHIRKVNARHTAEAEHYTTGLVKDTQQRINKDVQQGYKGLPMSPKQ